MPRSRCCSAVRGFLLDPPILVRMLCLWALASIAALASPAAAGKGRIFLAWNDCAQAGASSGTRTLACSDAGAETLYCAFTLPQALDSVVAVEVVLDIQHSDAVMPAWWQYAPGGCRDQALRPSADFT